MKLKSRSHARTRSRLFGLVVFALLVVGGTKPAQAQRHTPLATRFTLVPELHASSASLLTPSANLLAGAEASAEPASDAPSPVPSHSHLLGRKLARYHTMKVTGYVFASLALALTALSVALAVDANHTARDPDTSCGRSFAPALTVPAFAAGLAVGLTGTFKGRRLRLAHPEVKGVRNWRGPLIGAVSGMLFTLGAASMATLGSICNS